MTSDDPYSAFIGIDRSDAKIDITTLNPQGKSVEVIEISSKPEALLEWTRSLRKRFPQGSIAICIEQPCANLAAFFTKFDFIVLFLVNPASPKRWREAFQPSQAKSDVTDGHNLADFLHTNYLRLRPWKPDTVETRKLRSLVEQRRALVAMRTRVNNHLKALLKDYFPQALELTGTYLHARLACNFLSKWPTLQAVKKAKPDTIRKFYYAASSRRPSVVDQRLKLIAEAVSLTDDEAIIEPNVIMVQAMVGQFNAMRGQIEKFDSEIEAILARHDDGFIFASLPGAGSNFASRILVAFGTDRGRFESANCAQSFNGISPVRKQSGNSFWVQRRHACPAFQRQTFVEWAGQTVTKSAWARAYYKQQIAKGNRRYTALRALAYKWMRIIWRCWTDRVAYNEATYIMALKKSGSPLIALMEQAAKSKASAVNKNENITC